MHNKKYHIVTIGCQMNKNDSERIAAYLENFGFVFEKDKVKADLLIVTTCGVRQSAENRIYGLIPKLKKTNPRKIIILTGCLSKREDVKKRMKKYVDLWLNITDLPNLQNLLKDKISIVNKEHMFEYQDVNSYFKIKPNYSSSYSAFVPIGNGCDNFCTYCVVPYARGREIYRSAGEIINEVASLVKNGYKEINLIAQNVNSYQDGDVKKINFPQLLAMINDIAGDFWIRFSTSHPKDMSDELIYAIARCAKVCRHIHLPIQSGDNVILEKMNRKYTKEHYLKLIFKIREVLKSMDDYPWTAPVSISTDIIVGFPGETKKQFNQTVNLFKEVGFDMAYIAQYSPRPGTAAEKMINNVSQEEKKQRMEIIDKLLRKTAKKNNQTYINKVVQVMIINKNSKGFFGLTKSNKNVHVFGAVDVEIGEIINVKIKKVEDFGMEGVYDGINNLCQK